MPLRDIERGPRVEAVQHFAKKLPIPEPGKHLWVMAASWRVQPEAGEKKYHLDLENLIALDGPGCFWCMVAWRPGPETRCSGDAP